MAEAYSSRFESAPQGPESGGRPVRPEWSRKQKRGYQRVRSLLWFWEAHHFQVLWVTLSTAEGGQAEKLTYHHKQLRQRIERQLGFRGLEYYQVRTEEVTAYCISFGLGESPMVNARAGFGSHKNGSLRNGKASTGLRWYGSRPTSLEIAPATASADMSSANTFRINRAT